MHINDSVFFCHFFDTSHLKVSVPGQIFDIGSTVAGITVLKSLFHFMFQTKACFGSLHRVLVKLNSDGFLPCVSR